MTENLKNLTLFRDTYLYTPYMGVPSPRAWIVSLDTDANNLTVKNFALLHDHCVMP